MRVPRAGHRKPARPATHASKEGAVQQLSKPNSGNRSATASLLAREVAELHRKGGTSGTKSSLPWLDEARRAHWGCKGEKEVGDNAK